LLTGSGAHRGQREEPACLFKRNRDGSPLIGSVGVELPVQVWNSIQVPQDEVLVDLSKVNRKELSSAGLTSSADGLSRTGEVTSIVRYGGSARLGYRGGAQKPKLYAGTWYCAVVRVCGRSAPKPIQLVRGRSVPKLNLLKSSFAPHHAPFVSIKVPAIPSSGPVTTSTP
jgi:hypothetical protein